MGEGSLWWEFRTGGGFQRARICSRFMDSTSWLDGAPGKTGNGFPRRTLQLELRNSLIMATRLPDFTITQTVVCCGLDVWLAFPNSITLFR